MQRIPVDGGPADGASVPPASRLRWIDGERGKGYVAPGPGRALYELRGARYVFVGYLARLCEGCGAFLRMRRLACPVCGGASTPAAGGGAEQGR